MAGNYQTAAAIITAVEIETLAVRSLYSTWEKIMFPGDRQAYCLTTFQRDNREYSLVTAQQDVMGMTSAALNTFTPAGAIFPAHIIFQGRHDFFPSVNPHRIFVSETPELHGALTVNC